MNWKTLLKPEIQEFMAVNQAVDVKELGLKKPPSPDWPYPLILDQIKARQKAKIKLPRWQEINSSIIFPPADLLEQASSAATSRYKAALIKGKNFIDLSAGCGVDAFAFSEHFEHGICIERDENAASLLAHNLPLLSKTPIEIICDTAENFMQQMPEADLIYIDPQRRDENRRGFYRLEDCSPNIIELLPHIKNKTQHLMVKTSPMLDIHTAIKELECVSEIHIVEWQGECKEVLYLLNFKNPRAPVFIAVNIDDNGEVISRLEFTSEEESQNPAPLSMPLKYLYEPGPAFQKSGAFNMLANKFRIYKLHKHTHLYTSDEYCPDFPGRHFEILDILPVDRKALKIEKANLSIRNFPSEIDALKKKLKLKDGGDNYLFACTLMDEQKKLIFCQKCQ